MAHFFVKEVFLLFVAWAVFMQTRFLLRWRIQKRWSRENGCGEAIVMKNKLPWGLERFAILFNGKLAST